MTEPRTIAVSTPTGHVGRPLVRHLIRAGVRPRVLVRDPSRLEADVRDHVDVREVGDLADPAAVTAATKDVDALHLAVPSLAVDDPVTAYAEFGTAAAHAIAANRIGRTVLQSSVGAELRQGPARSTDWPGSRRSSTRPSARPAWVAADDIASVAAGLLRNPDWSRRQVQAVHGPADLSWSDAARIIADVTGREVRAERIPDEAMRTQLLEAGMPAGQAEAILAMSTGLRDGSTPEQPRDVTATTGTALRSWVVSELPPSAG